VRVSRTSFLGRWTAISFSSWSINQLCDHLEQVEQLRKKRPTPKVTSQRRPQCTTGSRSATIPASSPHETTPASSGSHPGKIAAGLGEHLGGALIAH